MIGKIINEHYKGMFLNDTVYLKNTPIKSVINVITGKITEVYFISKISEEEKGLLIKGLSNYYDVNEDEIRKTFEKQGIPIPIEHVKIIDMGKKSTKIEFSKDDGWKYV